MNEEQKAKEMGQLVREIQKTDRVLKSFYITLQQTRNWEKKDKSNSSALHWVLEATKDIEIPEGQGTYV